MPNVMEVQRPAALLHVERNTFVNDEGRNIEYAKAAFAVELTNEIGVATFTLPVKKYDDLKKHVADEIANLQYGVLQWAIPLDRGSNTKPRFVDFFVRGNDAEEQVVPVRQEA